MKINWLYLNPVLATGLSPWSPGLMILIIWNVKLVSVPSGAWTICVSRSCPLLKCLFSFPNPFFFFLVFLGPHPWNMEVPWLGVSLELQLPCYIPQPQQCRIQATSSTYTSAHSNTRFLTYWAEPGIEPASSWILVGFITTEPQWEFLQVHFLYRITGLHSVIVSVSLSI